MSNNNINESLWIAVKVERGFPAVVKCFRNEKLALKLERKWRREMNLDYDETEVFEVSLKNIN